MTKKSTGVLQHVVIDEGSISVTVAILWYTVSGTHRKRPIRPLWHQQSIEQFVIEPFLEFLHELCKLGLF